MSITQPPPKIGDLMNFNGYTCRVFKVHKFGTVDVVTVCGKYAWRVTGLSFL